MYTICIKIFVWYDVLLTPTGTWSQYNAKYHYKYTFYEKIILYEVSSSTEQVGQFYISLWYKKNCGKRQIVFVWAIKLKLHNTLEK